MQIGGLTCFRVGLPVKKMTDPNTTEIIIEQGKALVHAIEAIGIIEPSSPFERTLVAV